jgi:sulfide dehydrogenase cytochrome subunit
MLNFAGVVLAFGLVLPGVVAAEAAQDMIAECEACHGPGGVSTVADTPSLAGDGVAYLRKLLDEFTFYERHCTLTSYRYGDRPKTPTNMCNVANSLSDEEKQAVAEYFANQ